MLFFVVKVSILFLWLSSFRFVERLLSCFFLERSFPPCVGVFPLLSFEGLDSWKDTVCVHSVLSWNTLIYPSMVIESFGGYIACAGICVLLGSVQHLSKLFWLSWSLVKSLAQF